MKTRRKILALLSLQLLTRPSSLAFGSADECPNLASQQRRTHPTTRARIDILMEDDVGYHDGNEWWNRYQFEGEESELDVTKVTKCSKDIVDFSIPESPPRSTRPNSLTLHLNAIEASPRKYLQQQQQSHPQTLKTGTTIAGCLVHGHVIVAADTRATEGSYVADKTCLKLHPLARNVWCAGAGTSADLDHLTRECLFAMALQTLQSSTLGNTRSEQPTFAATNDSVLQVGPVSVHAICNYLQDALWEGQGNVGANLILGGVYRGIPYLRALHPHGSMDVDLPFAALGSGGLNAMAVLEEGYRRDLTLEEGKELVKRAIVSGIRNDLGSGSQVDMVVVAPDGTSKLERCVVPEEVLNEFITGMEVGSDETESGPTDAQVATGSNGFGNLPFSVQSKHIMMPSSETTESNQRIEWDKVLGQSHKEQNEHQD